MGKTCTNRYYLIDERHWRTDFKTMLSELKEFEALIEAQKTKQGSGEKVMSTEVTSPLVDIRCRRGLHHMLSKLTSNSKDNQRKDTQRKNRKTVIRKASETTAARTSLPEEVHLGKGERVRTYFDKDRNAIVHQHYE